MNPNIPHDPPAVDPGTPNVPVSQGNPRASSSNGSVPAKRSGQPLSKRHLENLAASGITAEYADQCGYRTVTDSTWLEKHKVVHTAVPGLLVPRRNVDGRVTGFQYRPDSPRLNDKGKPVKYETPQGQRNALHVPLGVSDDLGNPDVWLWVVEGFKKADCAAAKGFCAVGLSGVWNWKYTNADGGKVPLADWDSIALNGRIIVIAYDSDIRHNASVRNAALRLGDWLQTRGAQVRYLHLPDIVTDWTDEENSKTGLDDFLMANYTYDDARCRTHDTPPELMTDTAEDPTQPSEADITREIKRLNTTAEARRRRDVAVWQDPPDQGDALHQYLHRPPQPDWLIKELVAPGSRILVNAQWKTGKTTLGLNLVRSLVTGNDFLRRFSVCTAPLESVAYWNHEVDQVTFVGWLHDSGLTGPDSEVGRRVHPLHTRDFTQQIAFDNPAAVDWAVKWLQDRRVEFWLIDTLSRLYTGGENENDEATRWWQQMNEIAARAGVKTVVIFHHTGYGEGAQERGRGASAFGGLPDVLISYRHSGKPGEFPPDSIRWLKAYGRNVSLDETEIDYAGDSTRELFVTGSGNTRTAPGLRSDAMALWLHVSSLPEERNKTAICKELGFRTSGSAGVKTNAVFKHAEAMGWIQSRPSGKGREILYSKGTERPAGVDDHGRHVWVAAQPGDGND